MFLNRNSEIVPPANLTAPVRYARNALKRDMAKVFRESAAPGGCVRLKRAESLPAECYRLQAEGEALTLAAGNDLGFVYGLFEISRRFLGVLPFWLWNDQAFAPVEQVPVPEDFCEESRPARVRYRGWFINDETLLSHWKVERRGDLPFIMAFEALLRCGGNMVIPGTGENARRYRRAAADMGLILTHHHAEPLGAEMFTSVYPELEARYSEYPDRFRALWQTGEAEPVGHSVAYAQSYYGTAAGWAVAKCLRHYAGAALAYGPHEDDHAGDQFYNHVPRMLITQFIAGRDRPAESLRWLCALPALSAQANWCADRYAAACASYDGYLRECEATAAILTGPARILFQDSLLLQARLYAFWSEGALAVCQALQAGFVGDWARCFYLAGRAKRAYTAADAAMRAREHGKWIDFYANECQTDVKQTAQLCGYLMSFARTLGEGPHFYEWMRAFGDSEAQRRVMLILNTENHPDDDALWRLMEQRWGE